MYGEKIERYIDPLIIGTLCDIKGKTDDETERLKREKDREIKEKILVEREAMMNPFKKGTGSVLNMSSTGRLPSIREQRRLINSGSLDAPDNPGSFESIFAEAANALEDRYNPKEISQNAIRLVEEEKYDNTDEDGKMITLDPSEIEEEDSIKAEEIYNANPKDIKFNNKKVVDSDAQFERNISARTSQSSFNDELNWFMQNFK
jgi:hypothetical protein